MKKTSSQIKRIAILTSGGDAPGMNATIRAIVRSSHFYGLETLGVLRGYKGLIKNEFIQLGPRSVSNTVHRGGTFLKTSRCSEFETVPGLNLAKTNLIANEIDGLIVIGGDGTYHGAYDLQKIWPGKIVAIPGTIDNDLYGSDLTIGYDTAVNTALDAIDKIRDTAESHERFFLVEVMGRFSGFIALNVGVAGGAEEILIPEVKTSIRTVCRQLCEGKKKGKTSSIIIVAEGEKAGGAFAVAKKLKKMSGNEYRVVVLGHLQRGGCPSAADRILATELGAFAVDQILKGKTAIAVGKIAGQMTTTYLPQTWKKKKKLDYYLLKLLHVLAV
jgi:6-phosphofructokinase 1